MRTWLLTLGVATLASGPAHAVTMKPFKDHHLGFEIALPEGCRHATTPGSIEAVCAPSLDAAAARHLPAAGAWLFEIDFEEAPADAPAYSLDALRAEIPAMICGATDATGVEIDRGRETTDGAAKVFDADVLCPAIPFLALPERRAQARVVIAGQKRFRLLARTPARDVAKAAAATQAFLASFKLSP